MMALRRVAVVVLIGVALVAAAAAQSSANFVVARSGASFPAAPGGFILATLQEVQSATFAAAYNPYGVAVASGAGEASVGDVPHCAVLAVAEGILAFGPASNQSLIGPFNIATQAWESGPSLAVATPIQFGVAAGGFVGVVTDAFQKAMYTVPVTQAGRCYGKTALWAVFRPASFAVGRTGEAYPGGPSSDPSAVVASLADVTAPTFVTGYNAAGVRAFTYPAGSANGCCAIRVAEGYLTYTDATSGETFFIVPHFYKSSGSDGCTADGFASFDANQRFATRWGSAGSTGSFLHQLDYAQLHSFNTSFNGPSQCDGRPANSFALLKSGPSAASAMGDCWRITVQGDTYTPSTNDCLADRWHYDTTNGTSHDIALNSFNTCGGSPAVTGFKITNFNDKHALASVDTLSFCPGCRASDVMIPYPTGSEMSTVCYVTIGVYGWCRVLVSIEKNYVCPTPSP